MFEYQKYNKFFAQVADSMEDIGAEEIKEFGAKNIRKAYRGVHFTTDLPHMYRINYQSKFLSRVLAPLKTFDCHSTRYLYNYALKIDWDKLLAPDETFAISANVSNSKIKHSRYALQVLKDAIVDHFRNNYGERPSIDTDSPSLQLNLYIHKNRAVISLDTSGDALHKRGYRTSKGSAPMRETLAAAIIELSGWKGDKPLYDPMCGSGTLLDEALLRFCRIPVGYKRDKFGFEKLPDFNANEWGKIRKNSDRNIRELPTDLIFGSDLSFHALKMAKENASNLLYGNRINFKQIDFRDLSPMHNAIIVSNPPYGIRMGKSEDAAKLYQDLGDFLKNNCKGSTAYIYVGDRKLISAIGLKPSFKKPLKNGNLDGRLLKIDIY